MISTLDHQEGLPVVGPSLIRLVTSGLYDEPLAVYREYIQNSADAARRTESSRIPKVHVQIDVTERRVKIRDNGPGLSRQDAIDQLVPVGISNKTLGVDRGFRGVGRLAGLAFAEAVTFTTRTHRDQAITRVRWNADRLPILGDLSQAIESVVSDCVDIESYDQPGCPDHFFEVEVGPISRHATGDLLNRDKVRRYISEVCPVPFSAKFPYAKKINALFPDNEEPMPLEIVIEGDPEPVTRPFGERLELTRNRVDNFVDFEEVRIPSVDAQGNAAVGWVGHSSYLGALPKGSQLRGIRARVGNIQIGDETVFDRLYSEERFNRWCVGELHIVDHRVVPNARRDYFEPSPHLRNLENHLIPILHSIGSRCRSASLARNRARKALTDFDNIEEVHDLVTTGYLPLSDARALSEDALERLPGIRQACVKAGLGVHHINRVDCMQASLLRFHEEPYRHQLNGICPSHRAVYEDVFRALVRIAESPREACEMISAIVMHVSDERSVGKEDGHDTSTN